MVNQVRYYLKAMQAQTTRIIYIRWRKASFVEFNSMRDFFC